MEATHSHFKKTVLGIALVAALGTSASASAAVIGFHFDGLLTMLDPAGKALRNTSDS